MLGILTRICCWGPFCPNTVNDFPDKSGYYDGNIDYRGLERFYCWIKEIRTRVALWQLELLAVTRHSQDPPRTLK